MLTDDFIVLDPRFRKLVFGNVRVDKLWTGGRWAEGPAYFPAGKYLVWSDIPNDRVMRYDETDGGTSVFIAPAMNHNGHTVDREGRLISCEHRGRCVSRVEHDGSRKVLVDSVGGLRLNSPNDVVVKSDGTIWFSDPTYGIDSEYEGDFQPADLGASHVYRHDPRDGTTAAVTEDFVKPNGLCFSSDERLMYIADTGVSHIEDGPRHIRVFDVRPDGAGLANGRLFATCDVGGVRRVPLRRERQPVDLGGRRRALLRAGRDDPRQDQDPGGGGEPLLRRPRSATACISAARPAFTLSMSTPRGRAGRAEALWRRDLSRRLWLPAVCAHPLGRPGTSCLAMTAQGESKRGLTTSSAPLRPRRRRRGRRDAPPLRPGRTSLAPSGAPWRSRSAGRGRRR